MCFILSCPEKCLGDRSTHSKVHRRNFLEHECFQFLQAPVLVWRAAVVRHTEWEFYDHWGEAKCRMSMPKPSKAQALTQGQAKRVPRYPPDLPYAGFPSDHPTPLPLLGLEAPRWPLRLGLVPAPSWQGRCGRTPVRACQACWASLPVSCGPSLGIFCWGNYLKSHFYDSKLQSTAPFPLDLWFLIICICLGVSRSTSAHGPSRRRQSHYTGLRHLAVDT